MGSTAEIATRFALHRHGLDEIVGAWHMRAAVTASVRRRLALLLHREAAIAVLPIVAAAIVALASTAVASAPLPTQRGLVFVLGPLLLLVTLHARTAGYLHDDAVSLTLPLPIAPRDRFGAAHGRHMRGLAWQALWGLAAVALAVVVAGAGTATALALVLDLGALVVAAALVEPVGAAIAARFGQRVPEGSFAGQVQRSLGGGWTLPEAVVHLYAPALALGTAAAIAMPWQLAIDRGLDGETVGSNHLTVCAVVLVLALALRAIAPRLYQAGVHDAVPWLREAMRTLAGPSAPEPAPTWIARLRDPALRLVVLQHQRLTPVPTLRLVLLVGAAAIMAVRARPIGPLELGLVLALAALWLVPAGAVVRERESRRRALASLPVAPAERTATLLLFAPLALALAVLWIGTGGLA